VGERVLCKVVGIAKPPVQCDVLPVSGHVMLVSFAC